MILKLVSIKDTLLGHIIVPDMWKNWFKRTDHIRTPILPSPLEVKASNYHPAIQEISVLTVAKAYFSRFHDAVYLAEGTIEQLEQQPDCSFIPSYAYIKSMLQEHE